MIGEKTIGEGKQKKKKKKKVKYGGRTSCFLREVSERFFIFLFFLEGKFSARAGAAGGTEGKGEVADKYK